MKNNSLKNQELTATDKFQNAEISFSDEFNEIYYLCGKLSEEQLNVMKKFGDKKRAPHQYIYSENKAAALWQSAMDTLTEYARKKDWLVD